MGLPDILLSLLREPMSGTDLIGLFRGTIKHFWHTDLSQIYRALDRMEREGYVCSASVPSARGPAANVYRLTPRGRRRLAGWLNHPPHIPAAKLEYLAQLFSMTADKRPRERALDFLASMRDEAAQAVAALEAIETHFGQAPGYPEAMPASIFYPWLTLRHGLIRRRALLQWIDECLQHLKSRPAGADGDAGPGALAELMRLLRQVAETKAAANPT